MNQTNQIRRASVPGSAPAGRPPCSRSSRGRPSDGEPPWQGRQRSSSTRGTGAGGDPQNGAMVVLGSGRGWCDEEEMVLACLELLLPASTRSCYRRLPVTPPKADVRELLPPATSSICCSRLHPQLATVGKQTFPRHLGVLHKGKTMGALFSQFCAMDCGCRSREIGKIMMEKEGSSGERNVLHGSWIRDSLHGRPSWLRHSLTGCWRRRQSCSDPLFMVPLSLGRCTWNDLCPRLIWLIG
nr:uncharacterized protein LOC127321028 [Lolium perenne]